MWIEIINQIIENLQNVGMGMALFLVAYLSNMCFSIYVNCKIIGEDFDWSKILDSILKIIAFGLGTGLLCVAVTTIPIFANTVGFEIPKEYTEVFQNLAIIGVFLLSGCKYVLEAWDKMKQILSLKKISEKEEVELAEK